MSTIRNVADATLAYVGAGPDDHGNGGAAEGHDEQPPTLFEDERAVAAIEM